MKGVKLGSDDGMPRDCVANLDTITTIPKDCLRNGLISLSPQKLREIDAAIHFALGMKKYPVQPGSVLPIGEAPCKSAGDSHHAQNQSCLLQLAPPRIKIDCLCDPDLSGEEISEE